MNIQVKYFINLSALPTGSNVAELIDTINAALLKDLSADIIASTSEHQELLYVYPLEFYAPVEQAFDRARAQWVAQVTQLPA